MAIVYQHLRKDTREVFYVGIGKDVSRAYKQSNRTSFWKNIVGKYGYIVDILCSNISQQEAINIEKYLINFYGRLDNKTGVLCNMTDGGEGGSLGIIQSEETRNKKREANYRRDYKRGYKNINYPVEKVSKSVIQFDKENNMLNTFSSIIEASRVTEISVSNICQVCKGKRKTAGNFKWNYEN